MEYFDFIAPDECDERALFANRICKILYDKHNGNPDEAIIDGKKIFEGMEKFVRNIYELVENEIPLYAYSRLLELGKDNYDLTQEEYESALDATIKACLYYYG